MGETNKKIKLTKKEREARSKRMAFANEVRLEKIKEQKEDFIPELQFNDKRFVDNYIWGTDGMQGDYLKSYLEVFGGGGSGRAGESARNLMERPAVKKYIKKQMELYENVMKAERIRNIASLTQIRDEMSTASYINRFGEVDGVPSCRRVAIKSIEVLNKMSGFDKPTTLNINHNTNTGITFNVIAPSKEVDKSMKLDIPEAEEVDEEVEEED